VGYPVAKQPTMYEVLYRAKLAEATVQGLTYSGEPLWIFKQLAWYFSDDAPLGYT
jgi:hypothetical protein